MEVKIPEEIVLKNTTHSVTEEEYGSGDSVYRISFRIDDAFRPAKSHAAEVEMLCVYGDGTEGDVPYIAVQCDDEVYGAVGLFKEKGTFDGASELTPLKGKFLFRAKKEYYGENDVCMMYFYGFDMCDGFENNGLCLVYPKEYVGTENERLLMNALDDAAASFEEELISGSPGVRQDEEPAAVTERKVTAGKVIQTAVKTASVIRIVRIVIALAAILGILIYLLVGKIADSFSKHHIVAISDKVDIISEFTAEEQSQILDDFDITVPDSESGAHVASFMRMNRSSGLTDYAVEIDGVRDYSGFFDANSERTAGASLNELYPRENTAQEYFYITYNEGRASRADVSEEAHERIVQLFDEMYR